MKNKRRETIYRVENIIGFITIIAVILLMGSVITMVEEGAIITGSMITVIVCSIWLLIIGAYNYIVNKLFNR